MVHYLAADIYGEADRFDAMLEKVSFFDIDMMYILDDVFDCSPGGIKLL